MTQRKFGLALGYSGKGARDAASELETEAGKENARAPHYDAMVCMIRLATEHGIELWPGVMPVLSDVGANAGDTGKGDVTVRATTLERDLLEEWRQLDEKDQLQFFKAIVIKAAATASQDTAALEEERA